PSKGEGERRWNAVSVPLGERALPGLQVPGQERGRAVEGVAEVGAVDENHGGGFAPGPGGEDLQGDVLAAALEGRVGLPDRRGGPGGRQGEEGEQASAEAGGARLLSGGRVFRLAVPGAAGAGFTGAAPAGPGRRGPRRRRGRRGGMPP